MPRQARVLLDNVCYHIIARGNEKRVIFRDESDFGKYMTLILKYKERFGAKIYGWCLMPNHIHMVVESPQLSKFMHGIGGSYAKYFRYKYGGVGHLLQDRFKSPIIQKDRYLINCITYVEFNPVRAKLVIKAEEYKWSSYKIRILARKDKILDQVIF